MTDIVECIRSVVGSGSVVHETRNGVRYRIKGWGQRRGEAALVYSIPSRTRRNGTEKGVTASEIRLAHSRLVNAGRLCRRWFVASLPDCQKEGGCNFYALGGLFVLLGEASRAGSCYVWKGEPERRSHLPISRSRNLRN